MSALLARATLPSSSASSGLAPFASSARRLISPCLAWVMSGPRLLGLRGSMPRRCYSGMVDGGVSFPRLNQPSSASSGLAPFATVSSSWGVAAMPPWSPCARLGVASGGRDGKSLQTSSPLACCQAHIQYLLGKGPETAQAGIRSRTHHIPFTIASRSPLSRTSSRRSLLDRFLIASGRATGTEPMDPRDTASRTIRVRDADGGQLTRWTSAGGHLRTHELYAALTPRPVVDQRTANPHQLLLRHARRIGEEASPPTPNVAEPVRPGGYAQTSCSMCKSCMWSNSSEATSTCGSCKLHGRTHKCGICFEFTKPFISREGAGRPASSCADEHPFCSACIGQYVAVGVDEGRCEIRCPDLGCCRKLSDRSVASLVNCGHLSREHHARLKENKAADQKERLRTTLVGDANFFRWARSNAQAWY